MDLALYFLVWGESSNVRFCSELLCFVFKCAKDSLAPVKPRSYLDNVVRPIYDFLKDQLYKSGTGAVLVRRNKDHSEVIGYDDCNELFWSESGIRSLHTSDGRKLIADMPKEHRYDALSSVQWTKIFRKTYLERRTPLHLVVNFAPIWIAHGALFYYLVGSEVVPKIASNDATAKMILGLGGAVSIMYALVAILLEPWFMPRLGVKRWWQSFAWGLGLLILNLALPAVTFLRRLQSTWYQALSIVQVLLSIATTILCICKPRFRWNVHSKPFNGQFPKMKTRDRMLSVGFWLLIAASKLVAGYFDLIVPMGNSFQVLWAYGNNTCSNPLCTGFTFLLLGLFLLLNLILFHLDGYIWYISESHAIGLHHYTCSLDHYIWNRSSVAFGYHRVETLDIALFVVSGTLVFENDSRGPFWDKSFDEGNLLATLELLGFVHVP